VLASLFVKGRGARNKGKDRGRGSMDLKRLSLGCSDFQKFNVHGVETGSK